MKKFSQFAAKATAGVYGGGSTSTSSSTHATAHASPGAPSGATTTTTPNANALPSIGESDALLLKGASSNSSVMTTSMRRTWVDRVRDKLPPLGEHEYEVLWERGVLGVIFLQSETDGTPYVSKATESCISREVAPGDSLLYVNIVHSKDHTFAEFFKILSTMKKPVLLRFERAAAPGAGTTSERGPIDLRASSSKAISSAHGISASGQDGMGTRGPFATQRARSLTHQEEPAPKAPVRGAFWRTAAKPTALPLQGVEELPTPQGPPTDNTSRPHERTRSNEGNSRKTISRKALMDEIIDDEQYVDFKVFWDAGSLGLFFGEERGTGLPIVTRASPGSKQRMVAPNDVLLSANGVIAADFPFEVFFKRLQQMTKPVTLVFRRKKSEVPDIPSRTRKASVVVDIPTSKSTQRSPTIDPAVATRSAAPLSRHTSDKEPEVTKNRSSTVSTSSSGDGSPTTSPKEDSPTPPTNNATHSTQQLRKAGSDRLNLTELVRLSAEALLKQRAAEAVTSPKGARTPPTSPPNGVQASPSPPIKAVRTPPSISPPKDARSPSPATRDGARTPPPLAPKETRTPPTTPHRGAQTPPNSPPMKPSASPLPVAAEESVCIAYPIATRDTVLAQVVAVECANDEVVKEAESFPQHQEPNEAVEALEHVQPNIETEPAVQDGVSNSDSLSVEIVVKADADVAASEDMTDSDSVSSASVNKSPQEADDKHSIPLTIDIKIIDEANDAKGSIDSEADGEKTPEDTNSMDTKVAIESDDVEVPDAILDQDDQDVAVDLDELTKQKTGSSNVAKPNKAVINASLAKYRKRSKNSRPLAKLPVISEQNAHTVPLVAPNAVNTTVQVRGRTKPKPSLVETPDGAIHLVKWKEGKTVGLQLREVQLAKGSLPLVVDVCRDPCCEALRHVCVGDIIIEINGRNCAAMGVKKTINFLRTSTKTMLIKFRHGPAFVNERVSANT